MYDFGKSNTPPGLDMELSSCVLIKFFDLFLLQSTAVNGLYSRKRNNFSPPLFQEVSLTNKIVYFFFLLLIHDI